MRENLEDCGTPILWVHGGAMLSNSLTKPTKKQQMLDYIIMMNFRYKIVYDESRRSEKVRKKQGMNTFEDYGSILFGAHNTHGLED